MEKRFGRFRGIYWQQVFLTTSTVLFTLLLLGALFFLLSFRYSRTQSVESLREMAEAVAAQAAPALEESQGSEAEEQLDRLLRFTASIQKNDYLISDAAGNCLCTTTGEFAQKLPEKLTEKLETEGENIRGVFLESESGARRFASGAPIRSRGGELLGFAIVMVPDASMDVIWRGFAGLYFMIAFVALLLALVAASVMSIRSVQPIRDMVRATRAYADGDFSVRMAETERRDEIGELAASFNRMADSMEQTERQRRDFIANISHELKTPMTTIAGYTDGILDGTIPPEEERPYLQIISDESRRLSRLVRRMLDVSQLQNMDPLRSGATFDLCESVRRVLISLEKKITDRDLDVDADIPDAPILVLGDRDLITQVVYNLTENAAKFARAGSRIYLGVETRESKALVTVRNEGDTIPPEEIPLLFERFHKSEKSRSKDKDGVGLGLYIVKTILAQHHEDIHVTSENGVTTFYFTLSIAQEKRRDA